MLHEGFSCFFVEFLRASNTNPVLYGFLLFTYAALAAIFLPIPVEFGLAFTDVADWIKALILGGGKAVGALSIFVLGLKVENTMRRVAESHPIFQRGLEIAFNFVRFTKWVGLLILLSIPFMPDTLPIYLYGIFNKEGQSIATYQFVLVNFVAGVIRAVLFLRLLPAPTAC